MIGKTISHYKILEKLGEGGMGVVYKAEDAKLQRTVALKFLPLEVAGDDEARERFINEARAASALNHPNICTIHAVEEDDQPFIAMEFVEGQELREIIIRNSKFLIDNCLNYAIQIARGLQAAHKKNIIHRDIKPANIMVTDEGQVKIMDFGLAKRQGQPALTQTGSTLGTVAYMSPEQAQGMEVDPRSDIFSFGAVLYELCSGNRPFDGDYEAAALYALVNVTPAPLPESVPEALRDIVFKCLEKKAENRYQSADQLLLDLRKLKREIDSSGSQSPQSGVAFVEKRNPRNRAKLVVAVAVLAILVSVAGKFGYLPNLSTRQPAKLSIGQTRQLTHATGLEFDPVFSPDGKMIAYAAGPADQMDIFVRQLSGGRAINLTKDLPGHHRVPQWSPDGTEVAFSASQSGAFSSVKVVPALGGIPKKIVDLPPNRWPAFLVWSPDGKQVAYVRKSETGSAIYVQPVVGGDPQLVIEILGAYAYSLSWSPDGARLAYVTGSPYFIFAGSRSLGDVDRSSIWVVPAAGGEPRRVTNVYFTDLSPVWTPDSQSLLFISTQRGGRDVYHLPLSASGEPSASATRLTTGLNAGSIHLSADGKRLVYSVFMVSSNIWSIRIPSRGPISIAEAKQITHERHAIEVMHVSPDGQWLAFDSNRSGNMDIYKMPLAGGEIQQLTTYPGNDFHPSWSPDGKEIAFYSWRDMEYEVCLMSPDGGPVLQLPHTSGAHYPVWSPDGTQIVYSSEREGRLVINLISRDDDNLNWSSPRTLATGGNANWAPDGHFIAFNTDSTVQVIALEDGTPRLLVESRTRPEFFRFFSSSWSQDGESVYFMAADAEGKRSFWSIPVSSGTPILLIDFDVPSMQLGRSWHRTQGNRLYFTVSERESDIWVMDVERDD